MIKDTRQLSTLVARFETDLTDEETSLRSYKSDLILLEKIENDEGNLVQLVAEDTKLFFGETRSELQQKTSIDDVGGLYKKGVASMKTLETDISKDATFFVLMSLELVGQSNPGDANIALDKFLESADDMLNNIQIDKPKLEEHIQDIKDEIAFCKETCESKGGMDAVLKKLVFFEKKIDDRFPSGGFASPTSSAPPKERPPTSNGAQVDSYLRNQVLGGG